MKAVSRFEANLLRLLHFFLRQAPIQQALPLLEARLERPKCLGRNAVELVQDALGKGIVLLLTRAGGWRIERHLRDDKTAEGRLWERTPPNKLGLSFSRNSLDFLCWVTARKPAEDKKGWQPVAEPALGDLVLLYFAYEQLRGNDLAGNLLQKAPLDTHALTWLCFPDDHARASSTSQPDFKPWLEGVGACILEALQPELASRWVQMEIDKGNITGWQQMRDLGSAQERALDGFLTAIEQTGRLDLARFLLRAAKRLLTETATHQLWVQNLHQHAQRLADRTETYRGAMAFLRQLPRLQTWARRAQSVGFYDEGYQASQLWKADWERFRFSTATSRELDPEYARHEGDVLTERAQSIIRQLDPMRQTEGQP
jgi:hypothetical protein